MATPSLVQSIDDTDRVDYFFAVGPDPTVLNIHFLVRFPQGYPQLFHSTTFLNACGNVEIPVEIFGN